MTPPSDSLGRTADVVPSKGHSPTAGHAATDTVLLLLSALIHPMMANTLTNMNLSDNDKLVSPAEREMRSKLHSHHQQKI